MFAFDQTLFWYRLVFAAELFIAEYLFAYRLKRRSRFWLRLGLCGLALLVITFFIPILWYNAIYVSAMFLVMFAVSVMLLCICYNEPVINIIFCGIAAYAVQHISYSLYQMIMQLTLLDGGLSSGIYGEGDHTGTWNVFTLFIYLECYSFVYGMGWFVLGRTITDEGGLYIDNVTLLWFAGLILFVSIVINAIVVYAEDLQGRSVQLISYLYSIISCVLALMVQFALKRQRKLEGDLTVVESMWQKDKAHYKLASETIDMINVKCHDLRHQIRAVRMNGRIDAGALEEIENSVSIYDSVVKTGNDALDVLLTEKSLYCVKHSVSLTCMADGAKLGFMAPSEIYSLFGNALENAIEHVGRYSDKDKRFVRLTVREVGTVLIIHIENYFEGRLDLDDGLPRTTKGDTNSHGYGMLSMRAICEKYGGNLFVKTKDGLFMLDMVIPAPPKEKGNG